MNATCQPINEHTPTPWAVDPDHRPGMGWNAHVVEASDPSNRVCFMTSGPEGKINAAFIVEAANNYAALKARVAEQDKMLAEAADFLNSTMNMEAMDHGFKITKYRLEQQSALSHAGPVARDGER